MSFKFDFQIDEDGEALEGTTPQAPAQSSSSSSPCYHVTLDELLDTLPETISYTPFTHPKLSRPLLRRDLFDARFQLISQDAGQQKGKGKADEYVDADTDLIPGLYEGGLKTWEGGVDLLEVLAEGGALPEGKRVLEVGCGTALPSCFLLQSLLATSTSSTIHLQDYNLSVLQLVTLPNLLLATLPFLPATSLQSTENGEDGSEDEGEDGDSETSGHLAITPSVKEAFRSLISDRGIKLDFTYGHWAGLASDIAQPYDLVLTAETIYAEGSVDDLINLLKAAVGGKSTAGNTEMKEDWSRDIGQGERVVLVAAKVLYFGVGGGLAAFLQKVEAGGGWWTGIKEWTRGVGRKVVRIGWK